MLVEGILQWEYERGGRGNQLNRCSGLARILSKLALCSSLAVEIGFEMMENRR